MKKAVLLVLLFSLSVCADLPNAQAVSNSTDTSLVEMFNYANTHNVEALERLRKQIELRKDKNLTAAYTLALYIASPEKYQEQYVDNFPVDSEGISYLNDQIELKGLTLTSYYFIEAIGLIAEEGNDTAIKKVIVGIGHSDAGAAELFCESLMRLFDKQLQKTIRGFSQIDEGLRTKAYSCFEIADEKEIKSLKAKVKKMENAVNESEIKIIREINNYR